MEAVFRSPKDEYFAELPEPPPPKTRLTEKIEDPYLTGLENYIAALGTHIRKIQEDERQRMMTFTQKLQKFKGKTTKRDSEEQARIDFQASLSSIRRKRKEYREMERDALNERIKYLDSMMQQRQEQEYLRYKLFKLHAIPATQTYERKSPLDFFALLFALLQLAFLLIMVWCVEYRNDTFLNNGPEGRIDDWYTFYTHISIMIFFAYGFLSIWLKKYGFGAVALTFLVAIISFEWGLLVNAFFWNADRNGNENWQPYELTMRAMIEATWATTAVVVSFGAVIGKLNSLEILVFSFLETLIWGVTYYITILHLKAVDPGGGIVVHFFGAIFGVAATIPISMSFEGFDIRSSKSHDLTSTYTSDLLALVGTIFLWVLFPSWNAALAPAFSQHRVAINTFLGLVASCVTGFIFSRVFRRKAFEMRDIQNLTLVGGISMASAHSIVVEPAVGLLIGSIAAFTVILFDVFVVPILERRFLFKVYDTRHILSIHGVSGFIAAVASIIGTANTDVMEYGLNTENLYFFRGVPRQAGFQAALLAIVLGIALVGGLFVGGLVLKVIRPLSGATRAPFTDENHFLVPADFPRSATNVQTEVQS